MILCHTIFVFGIHLRLSYELIQQKLYQIDIKMGNMKQYELGIVRNKKMLCIANDAALIQVN